MKKIVLCSTICCAGLSLLAQDSIPAKHSATSTVYQAAPLITIKGDEIRRFPSNNFQDAVNGLFPWVFSLKPNVNEFFFVVDGNLLVDVNNLSLNAIETISFSRSSLNGDLYPFSRAGTFYITLKKATEAKPLLSFSAQYNAAFSNDGNKAMEQSTSVNLTEKDRSRPGHLLTANGSLLAKGKRWNLHLSTQLDQSADPELDRDVYVTYSNTGRKDTSAINGTKRQLNLRSFAQFTYSLAANLNVGIYGSYFHGKTDIDTSSSFRSQHQLSNSQQNGSISLPHYNGGAFIKWTILKGLHNRASVEYAYSKLDGNRTTDNEFSALQNPGYRTVNRSMDAATNKQILIRDELNYGFRLGPNFQAGVSAIFSYLDQKPHYEGTSVTTTDNGMVSASGNTVQYDQKLTSLNGKFYFAYNELLSGFVGYARFVNKGISRFSAASKTNPYAGLELNLKKLLKAGSQFSRLDLSFNYGDLTRNRSASYWLPEVPNTFLFFSSPVVSSSDFIGYGTTVFPNSSLANIILKNRLISVQADAAFINNKLLAGIEWSQLRLDNLYFITTPIGTGPSSGIFVQGKETQSGISLFLSSKLIDQAAKEWTLRFNALIPQTQHRIEGGSYPTIKGTHNQLQVGIQNHFSLQKWYVQLNSLTALNKTTVNYFMLNYVAAGYSFSGSKKHKQNITAFAHGRNLFGNGSLKNFYRHYSYGGVGVNVEF